MDRRKQYLIKPRLQWRIAFIVLVAMVITVLVIFISFYFVVAPKLVVFNHPRVVEILMRFNYALLVSFLVAVVVMTIATIYLTHKIAGPLYRFEKSMEIVATGDLTHVVKTRRNDELKDLERAFNTMVESLRQKVINGEPLITTPPVEVAEVLPPGSERILPPVDNGKKTNKK